MTHAAKDSQEHSKPPMRMSSKLEQLRELVAIGLKRGWLSRGSSPSVKPRETPQSFFKRIERPRREGGTMKCPECSTYCRAVMTMKGLAWPTHRTSDFPTAKWCGNGGSLIGGAR